jgi:hypothetical protein
MPTSYSIAQIEHFKREAKVMVRSSALSHSQALDQLALQQGWPNWSLLMKHSQASTPPELCFSRTPEAMCLAIRVPQEIGEFRTRSDFVTHQVNDLCMQFISARNAVRFAIQYMECLLAVPRYRIEASSVADHEMRCWLPYCANASGPGGQIMVNRRYKPVGSITKAHVQYADFPHLMVALTSEQLEDFSYRPDGRGYLFNDGCAPWHGRQYAQMYLTRLRTLESFLTQ